MGVRHIQVVRTCPEGRHVEILELDVLRIGNEDAMRMMRIQMWMAVRFLGHHNIRVEKAQLKKNDTSLVTLQLVVAKMVVKTVFEE